MGFWANLFTHKKKRGLQFQEASRQIREGLFRRLRSRYGAEPDDETADLLAGAVVSELFSECEPAEMVRDYIKSNRKKVKNAVEELREDGEIRKVLSILFMVTEGIRRKQPGAFRDDFRQNPLEHIRELEIFMEEVREPTAEEFMELARNFMESAPTEEEV